MTVLSSIASDEKSIDLDNLGLEKSYSNLQVLKYSPASNSAMVEVSQMISLLRLTAKKTLPTVIRGAVSDRVIHAHLPGYCPDEHFRWLNRLEASTYQPFGHRLCVCRRRVGGGMRRVHVACVV